MKEADTMEDLKRMRAKTKEAHASTNCGKSGCSSNKKPRNEAIKKLKLFAGYVAGKRGMQTQTAAPIIPEAQHSTPKSPTPKP